MPWGRTPAQRKEDCFGCSFQTNPVPRSMENQGGWRHGPSGGTHGPLAHLHCRSLEGIPKERADGLQIFLKVTNCYYLLQFNWKRKKIQKGNPYRKKCSVEIEGQKIYTFCIKLEISFILKKSTFSLKYFFLIAFFGKILFKTCFINHRVPFFMKKINFFSLHLQTTSLLLLALQSHLELLGRT